MIYCRWETSVRFYEFRIQHDLLGHLILVRSWGQRDLTTEQSRQECAETTEQAFARLRTVIKSRRRENYQIVRAEVEGIEPLSENERQDAELAGVKFLELAYRHLMA